ncbi:mechanosensitive ion channel protein MscS [Martelella endophytica]|uniref:Small-conductance mechanosensitive channel n=1 Tax=Martelella endophytica TaxID=1486262 RepID=A0A0D5LV72_MAREN|nr:mechanosensitive ion channel protein MscS [Martelella endophytica]
MAAGVETIPDEAIATRIEGIFDEIDGLETVSVSVRSGVVTLTGLVAENRLMTQAEKIAARVSGVVAVTNRLSEETSVGERLTPVYERLHDRTLQAVSYLPLIAVALIFWALVALFGAFLARRGWPFTRLAPNAFIADLLRQLVRIVFIVVGGVLALDVLGATALLGTLLGAAGIVGLAVGFAVRDTVENYIASILLSVRQPFRPQDYVKIETFEGFVISLTSRATILMDIDGNHNRIPNATVFKSAITNYTVNPQRRFTFEVGVGANSNLDRALAVGLDTVEAQPFVLEDPPADAWIDNLGNSNVVLVFVGWVDQRRTNLLKARSEAMRLVKRALEANGFSLPEPIYRLRFDSDIPSGVREALPAPEAPAPETTPPETSLAKDTAVDEEFQRRVARERDATGAGDLLDERAPTEFGGRQ